MTTFFTSDPHFGHKKVVDYCNRPFRNLMHMHLDLVLRWNQAVSKQDTVYVLGDFSLHLKPQEVGEIVSRLNGQTHLILGNHDDKASRLRPYFQSVSDIKTLKIKDPDVEHGRQLIVLCHYPMLSWKQRDHGSWMLHGHSHGGMSRSAGSIHFDAHRMDVGVDCHNFTPISYESIKRVMENRRTGQGSEVVPDPNVCSEDGCDGLLQYDGPNTNASVCLDCGAVYSPC